MNKKIFAGISAVLTLWALPLFAQQTLTLHGRDEPAKIDPGLVDDLPGANIAVNLFEGLLRYHPKSLNPEPGIAESWTLSTDGRTYTFKLRSDLKWSDGSPLSAADFAYAWERVLRPATASQMAYQLYPIKNAEAYNAGKLKDPKLLGIKVLNPTSLQVTLHTPTPYFLKLMPFPQFSPVKKELVEKYPDQWTRPEHFVGNGPFVVKSWTPHKEIVMEKNPNYWEVSKVKLDSIRFLPVPDYDTAVKMYDAGQLDSVFELSPLKVAQLKNRPDFIGTPYLANGYYVFNLKVPPLDNPLVRKALALAVDRSVLTDKILRRGDIPTGYYIPPGIPGYSPPKGVATDIAKAKALLAEAGFGPGGKPFPTLEILYNNTPEHKAVAETLQNTWKKELGISVTLRSEEWKVYIESKNVGNFQIVRAGWVGDYIDPNTFLELFAGNSQQNTGHYSNPEYDKLLSEARLEQNGALRARILKKAEAVLLEDMPLLPLYALSKNGLIKPYVKGYYPNMQDVHPLYHAYVEK